MERPTLLLAIALGIVALAAAACGLVATGSAETITLTEEVPPAAEDPTDQSTTSLLDNPSQPPEVLEREYEIVTLLPQDAIPAIDNPQFLTAEEATDQFDPFELVLGISINGDSRAYSIPQLSSHEIVNDVVGGIPVAVTW